MIQSSTILQSQNFYPHQKSSAANVAFNTKKAKERKKARKLDLRSKLIKTFPKSEQTENTRNRREKFSFETIC